MPIGPEDPNYNEWGQPPAAPTQPPAAPPPADGQPDIVGDQWRWGEGDIQQWGQSNYIDPSTGELRSRTGQLPGLVPHTYGLQIQAQHEQAIWRRQQSMMQGGINYAKGALGLLQSFRPGGGATLEAGQYNNLAQLQFQRAQLTQPIDMLGDYRRHEGAIARQKANRAQERALAVQIAGIAVGAFTGGAGAAIIPALAGAASTYMQNGGQYNQSADRAQPVGPGNIPPATQRLTEQPNMPMGTGQNPNIGPSAPIQGPVAAPPGTAAPSTISPDGTPQQGPQQGPGGPPQQGAPPGGGGPFGGLGAPVGSNGDFSSVAYASQGVGRLAHPVQQLALTRIAADMIENDPVMQGFTIAIDQRLAERFGVPA